MFIVQKREKFHINDLMITLNSFLRFVNVMASILFRITQQTVKFQSQSKYFAPTSTYRGHKTKVIEVKLKKKKIPLN